MGQIRHHVYEQHLNSFQDEENLLKAFLPCFYITFGRRWKAYSTELSVYFLSAEPFMQEAFGFDQELMLIYSHYPEVEPRSVQAMESFFFNEPAKGRVEKLTCLFVSEAPDVANWFAEYSLENPETRLIVPFHADSVRTNANDAWYVRNILQHYLFARDLFDYRLPLEKDLYFFGRGDVLRPLQEAAKRCENRGIFGLRKTGKTSVLLKLQRQLQTEQSTQTFFYDCKLPSIRKLRWNALLARICRDIVSQFALRVEIHDDELRVSDSFAEILNLLPNKVLLIFDEVEFISPLAIEDQHWRQDFVSFWQTFWACQSKYRKISALLAGVNPTAIEKDAFGGIQNPLFGIVSNQYLKGLSLEDTRQMIRTLGKRMGLKFTLEASSYIYSRYGGHPLLTRIACSLINAVLREAAKSRPVEITEKELETTESGREAELAFYCRHVVSELKQFYPDEYEMLELLACGRTSDFIELASQSEYIHHLQSYGLLKAAPNGAPSIAIPVVGRYVAMDLAQREGRKGLQHVVTPNERVAWVHRLRERIILDLRFLERVIDSNKRPQLFGPNSFPEAERFASIEPCESEKDFESFINICNRCFVESIENFGASKNLKTYFWNEIKTEYPGLWDALNRIKLYRHERFHLVLTSNASTTLSEYLKRDLDGKSVNQVLDGYFLLQQRSLDGLLTGLQIEIAKLS
jgi:hypothetical protein